MVPIAPFGIFGGVFQASGGMVALAYVVGMVGDGVHRRVVRADVAGVPDGRLGLHATRAAASPPVGFLAGWVILLDYVLVPGCSTSSRRRDELDRAGGPGVVWLVGFVVLNTVVNYFGIEITARINKIMLVAELIVLAIFLVIGVVALAQRRGPRVRVHPAVQQQHVLARPRLRCGVDRGAVLPRLRRHLHARRGEPGRRALDRPGRWSPHWLLAGTAVHRADLGRGAARARPGGADRRGRRGGHGVLRRRGGGRRGLAGHADRGRHGDRVGFRQLARRAGRHVAAAVRDGPRPAAAVVPAPRSHPRHRVPVNATLLVAVISLALGLYMAPATTASRCCPRWSTSAR